MIESKELNLFKKTHSKQSYSDGRPYWHHIFRVGQLLNEIIQIHKEIPEETKTNMIIAAYGHDVLEDTEIKEDEITNKNSLEMIKTLTNKYPSEQIQKYVERICNSNEETRMIKLADLIDNYTRLTYLTQEVGKEYIQNKILPQMEPMFTKIIKTEFKKYPTTGTNLINMTIIKRNIAIKQIEII